MLHIFICEDNITHKNQIEKCIENYIMINDFDHKIALSTDNPDKVIDYLKQNRVTGLYFLDVDLNHELDGIKLAGKIREFDPRGFIVFITTHDEALPLTFQYKVEAMDFILKEEFYDLQNKIHECIFNAHKRYSAKLSELQRTFSFTVFDKLMTIECSKIYFFETVPGKAHKVHIYTTDGVFEFYGLLSQVIKELDSNFYRCHKSYIINLQQELELNPKERLVRFKNGSSCGVSSRKLSGLRDALNSKHA